MIVVSSDCACEHCSLHIIVHVGVSNNEPTAVVFRRHEPTAVVFCRRQEAGGAHGTRLTSGGECCGLGAVRKSLEESVCRRTRFHLGSSLYGPHTEVAQNQASY